MSTIVSWGEILWDRFPHGDELGGAPANVAFHLAALGADVALVSRVGQDADGEKAASALAAAGVDTRLVQRDPERQTGEVTVEIGLDGDARYTLHPGRAWERIACTDLERGLLGEAGAFCFGTLAQRTSEGRANHLAAIAALPAGALAICDPNLRSGFDNWPLLRDSLAASSAVKINENEARTIERESGADDAITWLHETLGVDIVAYTRGANGCRISNRAGVVADHPGFAATPGGDNVGCGDAFVAVFAFGLLAGWSLESIALRGNERASRVASHRGATPTLE